MNDFSIKLQITPDWEKILSHFLPPEVLCFDWRSLVAKDTNDAKTHAFGKSFMLQLSPNEKNGKDIYDGSFFKFPKSKNGYFYLDSMRQFESPPSDFTFPFRFTWGAYDPSKPLSAENFTRTGIYHTWSIFDPALHPDHASISFLAGPDILAVCDYEKKTLQNTFFKPIQMFPLRLISVLWEQHHENWEPYFRDELKHVGNFDLIDLQKVSSCFKFTTPFATYELELNDTSTEWLVPPLEAIFPYQSTTKVLTY